MTIISKTSNKAHVEHNNQYFVVSDNGSETLIFPSNREGKVTNFSEVGGGVSCTLSEVLQDFANFLWQI